jgi:hypothetical protein
MHKPVNDLMCDNDIFVKVNPFHSTFPMSMATLDLCIVKAHAI